MEIFDKIIKEVEFLLVEENKERELLGSPVYFKSEITVLGQVSLFLNKEVAKKLPLVSTMDVDALIKGDPVTRKFFITVLSNYGFVLDDLSNEIWIPEGEAYLCYHDSDLLKVSYLDPISTLTSKAIKARAKNKILIRSALNMYGDKLSSNILNHGGDIDYFFRDENLDL